MVWSLLRCDWFAPGQVSRFVEARRNVPSVLYLPDAHQWWDGDDAAVHPHLRYFFLFFSFSFLFFKLKSILYFLSFSRATELLMELR